MRTSFWGRPAWKFLFTIIFSYPQKPTSRNKYEMKEFFTSLGNILPCKYCRDSYKKYIKQIPIDNYLGSKKELCFWLYTLHNKVNDKLRVQGRYSKPNPTFISVCKYYEQNLSKMGTKFWGPQAWRFLFAVTFSYPQIPTTKIKREVKEFFIHLGNVLPHKNYQDSYKKFIKQIPIDNYLGNRREVCFWLYTIHNKVNDKLRAKGRYGRPNPTFEAISKLYNQH